MLDPDNIDFKKLGFHAGLEVHHQLKSKKKLFCNCPAEYDYDLQKKPQYMFHRRFRAVLGEMGDYDPGMLVEVEKGYLIFYHANDEHVCTYEMDETPPFWPNQEPIDMGIHLSYLFNCKSPVNELVINRKQYLDGSITTGFQRTMIIARDGYVELTSGKKISITNILVEEDAARKIKTENRGRTVYYNLDRLGIPLTEIITNHEDIESPEELIETAKMIGLNVRANNLVKRGIGTARQDINISISGGDRVELKGVQDLSMFHKFCSHEVCRQHALLDIKERISKLPIKKENFVHEYVDISHLFSDLENGDVVYAIRLPAIENILLTEVQPNKDFGSEIFEKCSLITGLYLSEFFHSGEIKVNSIRNKDLEQDLFVNTYQDYEIRKILNLNNDRNDAYIIAKGPTNRVFHSLKISIERIKISFDGVPQETRRVLLNGNNEFLRVIHGKERLYPDTDTPPMPCDSNHWKELSKEDKIRPITYFNKYKDKGLTFNMLTKLVRNNKLILFDKLAGKSNIDFKLVFRALIELPTYLSREGFDISYLTDEIMENTLIAINNNKISKSALISLMKSYCYNKDKAKNYQLLEAAIISNIPEEKLREIVKEQLKVLKNSESVNITKKAVMGSIMNAHNRMLDGKLLASLVEELL